MTEAKLSNNDTSQLSDEDLLREVLNALDDIKSDHPALYHRLLSKVCAAHSS